MFVALVPPDPVRAHLEAALGAVRDAGPGLRRTPPEQWHVTLAFLPGVDDAALPELDERLARAAARSAPVDTAVAGAGAFPRPSRAGVLWAGVDDPGGALRLLAARARAAARRSGVDVGRGPFRAHLTLARTSRPADLREAVQALAGYRGPAWRVEEVRLVASRLGAGPGGRPEHGTVAVHPLRRTEIA